MIKELSAGTLDFGREVTRAILGVDSLYRAESGDETGLAVLNMDTEGAFSPEPFGSYEDAADRWRGLGEAASGLTEADRRTYYAQLADATQAFIRWRREGLDFETQLGSFLQMPAEPVPDQTLDTIRSELRGLLGTMGYHGDLVTQAAAWEDRNRVPADEVEEVSRELMHEAWRLTNERVVEIPADESTRLARV